MISAQNKDSKLELRPTIHYQELKKENEALKKTVESLKKSNYTLNDLYEIRGLKLEAANRMVTHRESELKDLKEKISELSNQAENKKEIDEHSGNYEDDEDVEVIEIEREREKEKTSQQEDGHNDQELILDARNQKGNDDQDHSMIASVENVTLENNVGETEDNESNQPVAMKQLEHLKDDQVGKQNENLPKF